MLSRDMICSHKGKLTKVEVPDGLQADVWPLLLNASFLKT